MTLVTLVALVACACPGTQRSDVPPQVLAPEPPAPYEAPVGAVLTVMTRIVDNAPAGLLDRAAWIRLRLHLPDTAIHEWSTPIGGAGVWFVEGAHGEGLLEVDVLGPSNRVVAFNTARTSELQGLVGSLVFEFGSALPEGDVDGCGGCSSPERLSDIRGFDGAGLFWRSGGRNLTADAEVIEIRLARVIGAEAVAVIAAGAGGELIGPHPERGEAPIYRVRPVVGSTLDVARALSFVPAVVGLELR